MDGIISDSGLNYLMLLKCGSNFWAYCFFHLECLLVAQTPRPPSTSTFASLPPTLSSPQKPLMNPLLSHYVNIPC